MSKPRRYKWVCPRCEGAVLAVKAPSRDAVSRYCLDCSAQTGRLVKRTCPVLDAERKKRTEQRLEKARKKRERVAARRAANDRQAKRQAAKRRAAREEVAGDLRAELERIWPIALLVSPKENPRTDLPTLTLSNRRGDETSGRAWWGEAHRIHVSVALDDDYAGTVGVLAHEVAHVVHHDDEVHTPEFWRTLVAIVTRAYACELTYEDLEREPTAYKKQCAVEAAIRAGRGYE